MKKLSIPSEANTSSSFGQRLRMLRKANGETQSDFANRLSISQAQLHRLESKESSPQWLSEMENIFKSLGPIVSLWLMGYSFNEANGIRWIENFPARLPSSLRKDDIMRGVELFEFLVADQADISTIFDELNFSPSLASDVLRLAFEECAILLADIRENQELGDKIFELYQPHNQSLKRSSIIVADVPENLKVHIIRSEIIAYLAARCVFDELDRPHGIALGSGYTLMRFADQTRFTTKQFYGTRWFPLMAFPLGQNGEKEAVYTSNDVVSTMIRYHSRTKRHFIPFPNDNHNRYIANNILNKASTEVNVFFLSATGLDKNRKLFSASDYCTEIEYLSNAYYDLSGQQKKKVAGELLGWMINVDGSLANQPELIQKSVFALSIEKLKKAVEDRKRVWLLASRKHKQRVVLAALKNAIVNGIVIDAEIAKYLIENALVDLKTNFEALSDSHLHG